MPFQIVKLVGQPTPVIITGGFVPKGAYASSVDYSVGDSVDWNGSSYVMFNDAASNVSPSNVTYWQVVANKGNTGSTGATGATGANGQGVPIGGTTGQVLSKVSNTNYDTEWSNAGSGDMAAAVYDPQAIAGDAFDVDNHTDGTTNKVYTATEKTKLAGIATGANVGVVPNGAITGATKTKITYDAKGLVTAGADATTADIASSTDKNYVTDAQLVVIGNTSGTNTGDQTSVSGNAGTATTLQTARAIYGNNFDGSAALTQVIASTYGGTGNGFTKFSGPTTSEKTFTLPDSSSTIVVQGGALGTPSSGTLTNCTFPTLNQNTSGTASNLSGTPALPNGTTATTQSAGDNSTKLATTAYADRMLPLAGGTLTGSVTLGENTSVALDPAGSADGKYSGITVTGTGGATIAFGDIVTLDKDDSRWELVDISVAAAATGDARGIIGVAVTSSSDGGAITVLLNGIVRADANFPTLTIGAPVYASTTGDVVVTQPTTTDHVIRVVGFGLTADEMYFNPSSDYITHT